MYDLFSTVKIEVLIFNEKSQINIWKECTARLLIAMLFTVVSRLTVFTEDDQYRGSDSKADWIDS